MKNRKNMFLIIFLIIFAAGICAYITSVGNVKISDSEENVRGAHAAAENEKYQPMMYILKEYYGNIGIYIFADNEYALISVKDMDISVLPEADAEALKKGIYVNDKEEMLKLLEDYTS